MDVTQVLSPLPRISMFVGLLATLALASPAGPSSPVESVPTHVTIAPGVSMPYVNLGGVHSHPSNYSAWLKLGGTGLDSALMYGDDVQVRDTRGPCLIRP